nr:hypothetical protein [Streptomyces sp. 5-10]
MRRERFLAPLTGDGEQVVDRGPQGGDVVICASRRGEFGGGGVQGEAYFEELAGLVRVHGGHADVAMGVDIEETLAAEAADGLARFGPAIAACASFPGR